MGPPTLCHFKTRMVWNTKNVKNFISSEFYADKQTAFQWFHSSKVLDNTRDHRTYAQVVKTLDCNSKRNVVYNHVNSDPRIVTVNNDKVKPKIVAPSKVSVNAKGCTSPNRPSYVKTGVQTTGVSSHAQHQGFLNNRFQVLTDLLDDSSSNRYKDTGDSEGNYSLVMTNQVKHTMYVHMLALQKHLINQATANQVASMLLVRIKTLFHIHPKPFRSQVIIKIILWLQIFFKKHKNM